MRNPVLVGILMLIAFCGRAQPCVRVDSRFKYSTMSGCLMLFTDSTNRLPVNDVRVKPFQTLTTEEPNFGADALTHWVSFTCGNADAQPKQVVVELHNIFFDHVSFYVFDGERLLHKTNPISWKTPPYHRPLASRYYAFPLELGGYQSVQIFVRMQYKGGIFVCPVTLWERTHYQQQYQQNTVINLIPLAVLAIISFISALFWVTYRKRILLYYALYTGGMIGFPLNIEGFLVEYAAFPLAGPKGWIICSSIAWIGNLLFTEKYVFSQHTIPYTPLRRFCFRAAICFLFVFLGIALIIPANSALAFASVLINGLGPLFIFSWLLIGLRYRLPEARIYLLAVMPIMVCILLIALGGEGILPNGDKIYVLLYYAPAVEVIILGFGVVRQFFREREKLLLTVQSVQDQVIQTQESERQRIAADLHDDLGGTLATIRHRIADIRQHLQDPTAAQAFEALEPLIQKSGEDLRRIAHNLMPPEFARLGLRSALERLVMALPRQPTYVEFRLTGVERKLSLDTELNAYRIVSELVQNVLKHAQARRAAVQLIYFETYLSITVEDDGVGNEVKKRTPDEAGIGVKNSILRAEYIGATLRWEASAGGTLVVLDIPYPIAMHGRDLSFENSAH